LLAWISVQFCQRQLEELFLYDSRG
jgi:hypothetical protein